jgi:hypothetical protein
VPRVLYIAGYGRSGSTVLSVVLGNHPDVAAVGELTHLLDDWGTPPRTCSCGQSYGRCPFWGGLFPAPPPAAARALVRRIDGSRLAALSARWYGSPGDRRAYGECQRSILAYVAARSGKSVVVDASKSAGLAAGRPWALARLGGQDVYVLHLVRSGRATVASLAVRGSNWALEGHGAAKRLPTPRGALGWMQANLWVSLLGRRLGPSRYLRMRYEDFLADPATWLRRIGRFVGFDPEELVRRVEAGHEFPVPHMVGGNRVRMQPTVKLWREAERVGPTALRPAAGATFLLLGGWLERWYGYPTAVSARSGTSPSPGAPGEGADPDAGDNA